MSSEADTFTNTTPPSAVAPSIKAEQTKTGPTEPKAHTQRAPAALVITRLKRLIADAESVFSDVQREIETMQFQLANRSSHAPSLEARRQVGAAQWELLLAEDKRIKYVETKHRLSSMVARLESGEMELNEEALEELLQALVKQGYAGEGDA